MKSVTLNTYTYKELDTIFKDIDHPLHHELQRTLARAEDYLFEHLLKCYNENTYYYDDNDGLSHLKDEYRNCYTVPRIEDEKELNDFIYKIMPVVAEQHSIYFSSMGLPIEVDGSRFVPYSLIEAQEMNKLICNYTNYTDTL